MKRFLSAAKNNPKTTISALVLAGMAVHGAVHDLSVITTEGWWMKVVGAAVALFSADAEGDDPDEDLGEHFGFPIPKNDEDDD